MNCMLLFSTADVVVLNKYDMMEYFDFDDHKVEQNVRLINSSSTMFRISSRTRDGLNSLVAYVEEKIETKK